MNELDKAFAKAPRKYFLPDNIVESANFDVPLPIGFGQTNSQPSLVYDMINWLSVQTKDKVLDVGSGSGWTTAVLANLVGKNTVVRAVERIPELIEAAKKSCHRLNINNVRFYPATKILGLPKYAPYNKILVSAAASQVPQELLDQLGDNGTMVIPINHDIHIIEKSSSGSIESKILSGFSFVPLVSS